MLLARTAVVAIVACGSADGTDDDVGERYRTPVFDDVIVTPDLAYGDAAGAQTLRLDLYQPRDDDAASRPAVVWVHGGGFSGGDKRTGPSPVLADSFARLGYVAVSIDYRVRPGLVCFGAAPMSDPACLDAAKASADDAREAVQWLRSNADALRVDPDRIVMGGESAGGIIATMVGVTSDPSAPGSDVAAWISIAGGLPDAAAITGRAVAPGCLFASSDDPIVPYRWSVETAAALQRLGTVAVLHTIQGISHVPFDQHRPLFETESASFLYDQLDLDDVD